MPASSIFQFGYLERRVIIGSPRAEVEGQDEVDTALLTQHQRIWRVEGKAGVHHVHMLLVRLRTEVIQAVKLVLLYNWKHGGVTHEKGEIGICSNFNPSR